MLSEEARREELSLGVDGVMGEREGVMEVTGDSEEVTGDSDEWTGETVVGDNDESIGEKAIGVVGVTCESEDTRDERGFTEEKSDPSALFNTFLFASSIKGIKAA